MKNLFYLLLVVLILPACRKDNNLSNTSVKELWRFTVDNDLDIGEGAIFDDNYLVWSEKDDGAKSLEAYDINTQELAWEYNFDNVMGWGEKMVVHNNLLYCDEHQHGFTIFNLQNQQITASHAYADFGLDASSTNGYIYQNNLYKAIENIGLGMSTIISTNTFTGNYQPVFQYLLEPELEVRLASPIVSLNPIDNRINMFLMVHLENKPSSTEIINKTIFISANEDYSINWTVELDNSDGYDFCFNPPVFYNNSVLVNLGKNMYSFDKFSGLQNWVKHIDGNSFSKIVNYNDEIFVNLSRYQFLKIDPNNGEIIWQDGVLEAPPIHDDFEIFDNQIIYCSKFFGNISIINNETGKLVDIENLILNNISNPKLTSTEGLFLTHTKNRIIGFEIKK